MLLVKTYLKSVDGKGIGLFADEPIPTGTLWHRDESIFDKTYSRSFVDENGLTDFFKTYATYNKETDSYYLCSDNARFVNHSDTPNTIYDITKRGCVAVVDILQGEEITCDYRTICDFDKENGMSFIVK